MTIQGWALNDACDGFERWDEGRVVEARPFTTEELEAKALSDAARPVIEARTQQITAARQALTDAVQLAALSPYPTPEEQSIIDAQVSASLALFRALSDPPADVTALAAAVLTLEVQR